MRILWVGNSGWSHQGYGVQVRGLLPHLLAQGHQIAVFAFYGLEGGKVDLPLGGTDGPLLTHYPRLADMHGNDAVALHAEDWGADVVITLMDCWVNDPETYRPLNWLAWTPIDQEPIPEMVLARLPAMKRVLPYSRYGQRLIQQTGVPCCYIPHGVDCDVFRSFTPAARAAAKRSVLGFDEDTFVVGMVGANKGFPSRKGFPEAFQAFALLHDWLPQARLYVHSHVRSTYGGPNLEMLAQGLGIAPYVKFVNPYLHAIGISPQGMALTYNGFDVLLQASSHEGFGLPLLEAQACGTPVVAVDSTSMTELVAPGYGSLVGPLQKQLSAMMSWVAVPDVRGLAHALQRVHDQPPSDLERDLLVSFARTYAWPLLAEHYWKPMLDQVADELGVPGSSDKPLQDALDRAKVITEEQLEGDRHGCCCWHVVNELEAMPAPDEERLAVARDKLANCPHQQIMSELEAEIFDIQGRLEGERI